MDLRHRPARRHRRLLHAGAVLATEDLAPEPGLGEAVESAATATARTGVDGDIRPPISVSISSSDPNVSVSSMSLVWSAGILPAFGTLATARFSRST